MLAKRIIPCLDVTKGRVVKGVEFLNLRDAGDPVELGKFYSDENADELVFLDITASHEARRTVLDLANRVAEQVFIPFTVGGGIASLQDMRAILKAGADKVSINTAAVQRPSLITEAAQRFGSQCVVVAIDAKRRDAFPPGYTPTPWEQDEMRKRPAHWEVFIHGGRTPTDKDAVEWAGEAESRGAGEILLTSMDCDGTQDGYDLELTRAVAEAVEIPVIASGGAGTPDHMADAVTAGKAEAALIASITHFGDFTIAQIKEHLNARGIPVRLT